MGTSGPGVGEAMGLGDLCVLVLLFPTRQQPSCQHVEGRFFRFLGGS